MTMNYDCIRGVVSYLCGDDLRNAANVCSALREIAQAVFSASKQGEKLLKLIYNDNQWKKHCGHLRIFGSHIKSIQFVSEDLKHKCDCVEPGLECITYLLTNTPNLEHLEILLLPHLLSNSLFEMMHSFQKLKTLKVYSNYYCNVLNIIEFLRRSTNLTEFVWGYPATFNVIDLYTMVQYSGKLEKLVIICNSGVYAGDQIIVDEILYGKMLDVISNRQHKKPLHVIIIGEPGHVVRFRVTFPSNELLRISCVEKELGFYRF